MALVLIAGRSQTECGLFILDGTAMRIVDRLPTRALERREQLLYRVVGPNDVSAACDDLLVCDETGLKRTIRLDRIARTRRMLAHDRGLALATTDGAVYDVAEDGTTTPAPSNEKFVRWVSEGAVRALENGWLVCNAAAGEMSLYDAAGALTAKLQLDGTPCALAVDRQSAYIGECSDARAALIVIDLPTLKTLERREVDLREIDDLAVVSAELAAGVRVGSRTNSTRAQQCDQLAMFARAGVKPSRLWAVGDPLLPSSLLHVTVHVQLPGEMRAGELIELPAIIESRSDAILVTAPPNPTQICYRWFDESGRTVGDGTWIHTPLPVSLVPGGALETMIRIEAPRATGRYMLSVTLLQTDVVWFDDVDAKNAARRDVAVV